MDGLEEIAREVSGLENVRVKKNGSVYEVEGTGGFITRLGRYARPMAPVLGGLALYGGSLAADAAFPDIGLVGEAMADEIKVLADNKTYVDEDGLVNRSKFLLDFDGLRVGTEYSLDTPGDDNISAFLGMPLGDRGKVHLFKDDHGNEARLFYKPAEKLTIISGFAENTEDETFYGALDFKNKPLEKGDNIGGGVQARHIDGLTGPGGYGFAKVGGIFAGYGYYPIGETLGEIDYQHRIVIGIPGNKSFATRYFRVENKGFEFNHFIITPHEIGFHDIDFVSPLQDNLFGGIESIAIPGTNPIRFDNNDLNSRIKDWGLLGKYIKTPTMKSISGEFVKYLNEDFWLGAGYNRLRGQVSDDEVQALIGYTPDTIFGLAKDDLMSLRVVISHSLETGNDSLNVRFMKVF